MLNQNSPSVAILALTRLFLLDAGPMPKWLLEGIAERRVSEKGIHVCFVVEGGEEEGLRLF